MRNGSLLWEQFSIQRDNLILNLKQKLYSNMSSLIRHLETSDLILVAADGQKLPAHICILRQRAPVFFERHIAPTLDAQTPRQKKQGERLEVAIGDVDSAGLTFFIRSVYTDDEIRNLENKTAKESSSEKREDDPDLSNFEVDDEYDQPYANQSEEQMDETPRRNNDKNSLDRTPANFSEASMEAEYSVPITREHDSGFHQPSSIEKPVEELTMTSFRELATESPMCLSGYSERSQYDIVEEDEHEPQNYGTHGRFLQLEDSGIASSQTESPKKQRKSTKIFPMFIGFGNNSYNESEMSQSMPSSTLSSSPYSSTNTLSAGSIRGRAMLARRLSVTSLTSLTSIDLTPTTENVTLIGDKLPCSKLGADLLEMYQKSIDTDVTIATDGGDLHAHKCILWATCPAFRKTLKMSTKIELRGFSRNAIDFLLSFLYGGLTCIPEDIEVWEIITLATHLNIDELAQVAALHLKTHKCHFFHRPCATCVSAVFDALPQFRSIKCLNSLFDEAMSWQARHFSRIWKGRVFFHLDEKWQQECRDALINEINEEYLIDTLLGCEKLQVGLPRIKSQQLAESVQTLVNDVIEYCTEFLISSFDLVIGSKAFKGHGKGLALNLALLEDIFPPLVHSLTADTAIRAFISLRDLLIEIQQSEENLQQSPQRSFLQIPIHDWNSRFIHLCRKLFESIDKHLLHYAYHVVKSDAYQLLSDEERARIEEAGLFVEMHTPKARPPKLSSFNRTYKRSESVGVRSDRRHDRTQSLSRPIISQVVEVSQKEELEREKSFIEIHRRANSMKNSDSMRESLKVTKSEIKEEPSKPSMSAASDKPPIGRNPSPASKIPAPSSTLPSAASTVKRERSVSPATSSKPRPQQLEHLRTPKKGPPPVKKMIKIANPEDFMLERENTRTIITKEQHKELGVDPSEMGVPQVTESPKIKPKSVVRPMPKNPSLAASTPVASILPQSSNKELSRTKSNSIKAGSSSRTTSTTIATTSQRQRPKSSALPSRQTASNAARAVTQIDRTKRVESKIPKVRA